MMTVLIVAPRKKPKVAEVENSAEALAGIVGGPIEKISPFAGEPLALIYNGYGNAMRLPMNRILANHKTRRIILGTFVLCGITKNSNGFISLTEKQIDYYKTYFWGCPVQSGKVSAWYDPTNELP